MSWNRRIAESKTFFDLMEQVTNPIPRYISLSLNPIPLIQPFPSTQPFPSHTTLSLSYNTISYSFSLTSWNRRVSRTNTKANAFIPLHVVTILLDVTTPLVIQCSL